MCIKSVYYNTYSDGQFDITERVESCTPGYMCANPRIIRYDRDYAAPRDQAKASQARTDRLAGSPRSLSPSSPGSSRVESGGSDASSGADRKARVRKSDVYVNGTKVVSASSMSAPRPIPIKRAATMTYGGMEPPPERGRRPIIVEERVPASSTARIPLPPLSASPVPVEVLEHSSSPRRRAHPLRDFRDFREVRSDLRGIERTPSLRRRERDGLLPSAMPPTTTTTINNDFLSPHRNRADRSPQGYGSAEDEQDRAERRRRRRTARERASVMPSSLPAFGNTDVFGSSYESTSGASGAASSAAAAARGYGASPATTASSSFASPSASPSAAASAFSSAAASSSASPAVAAVKKELRWEDEMRRQQNERIRLRPKLPRAQAVPANAKLQGEVKSILKNSSSAAPSGAATPADAAGRSPRPSPRGESASSSRRASFVGPAPDMDDIFAAGLAGLNINGAAASSPADAAERAYQSRLRNRFSMPPPPPPRRYTAGGPFKRRTEIWYPEEGRYRFM